MTNIIVFEGIMIIYLIIVILYHCSWYGYSYYLPNDASKAEVENTFGLTSHNFLQYLDNINTNSCKIDGTEMAKMIQIAMFLGSTLYLFGLILKHNIKMLGLILLVCNMILLGIFILYREKFVNESIVITKHNFKIGYWLGLVFTGILTVINILN